MILTDDDDDDCLNVTDSRTTSEVITNENRADYFIQKKPIICTFFKPKTKINQILTDNTKQNGGIFEKIKQSICCDIDNECHDYKFPKAQTDFHQLSSNNPNLMKFDTLKQESIVKCERDLHSSFSTESSSLSNLPTISATYSKSTKSLSDSDNQDQLDNPTNSLIVKEVYSLCETKLSISTRNNKDANKSTPLNTSTKSCDNTKITVKKSVPAIKKLTKPSPKKPCNKSKAKSSTKTNSKTTEETVQRIVNVFKLVKQHKKTKTNNTNLIDINDTQSESSDALTEAMREDINDFDLEPVETVQSKYTLMQPIILLEPLQIDKISRLKRKFSNSNCVNSWEPLEKKLKLNCSFVSNDSTKTITKDKFNLRKNDDASITTEKTSLSCDSLFNERNNSHNRVIYHSMTDIVENDIIYCFVCKKSSKTLCKIHPVSWIANEYVDCPYAEYFINETFEKYFNNSHSEKQLCSCNQNELDHIQISLPKIFHLKESANSEIGIWTKQRVKQGSIIGPYLGEIVENWKSKKSIGSPYKTRRLMKSGNFDELHCLEFAFKSNWMRCINFTNEDALANLKVIRYDGKIFFQSTREITANRELLVSDKGDFEILKLKKKPICKLNCSGSVNVKNRSISGETLRSSQDKPLNSDRVKNVPSEDQKINKSVIKEKEKILKNESQIKSVSERLPICEIQHRKKKEITVNKTFSKYLSRLKWRHRERFLSKIDREIIDYVSELMIRAPLLTSSEINKKFRKIFPSKPEFSNFCIKQIICLLDLRPLQGIIDNNDDDDIDREIVEEIVEMFTFNKGLKLEEAEKHLSIEFPNKKRKLSVETIDKIVKLNRCRISEEQDIFRVDQDVLKEIKTSITAGDKSKQVIFEKLQQKFPEKEIITTQYIGFLVKKYNLLKKKSNSVISKFDEEMKSTIEKLYQDHPEYSALKINDLLRNLLPDKPVVSRHTIAKRIRQFRSANRC